MTLTNPWAIDGPEVDAATAKQLAYQATAGATGIAGSRDLLVRQTATPGTSVEVLPGSYVVPNRNAKYQSYSGRNLESELVEIPASGSTGSRTYFLGIEIIDPEYPGNTGPVEGEEDTFEYVKFVLRTSLTPNLKTFLPLAKIVVPANTATITNSMITSLRKLSNPRSLPIVIPRDIVTGDTGLELKSRSAYPDGEWFPNVGGNADSGRYTLDVPEWATKAQIRCEWLSVYNNNNPGAGMFWVSFGPEGGSNSPVWYTQGQGWNSTSGSYMTNWIHQAEINIRPEWRGNTLSFYPRANKTTDSSYPGTVGLSARSSMNFEIRFLEEADVEF